MSGFAKILVIVLPALGLIHHSAIAGENRCTKSKSLMKLHFELYPEGQRKIIESALNKVFADHTVAWDHIPRKISFGAQPECKNIEAIEKMLADPKKGTDYVWGSCFGPPYALVSKHPDDHRGRHWEFLPEPSDFQLENFRITTPEHSGYEIQCAQRTCRVKVPVTRVQVQFDATLQSRFFKQYLKSPGNPNSLASCYSGALRDVKIDFDSKGKKAPALAIEYQFKFGDPDSLVKIQKIDPSRESYGIGHLQAGMIQTSSVAVQGEPGKRRRGDPVICPWSDSDVMSGLVQTLLKAKIKDQFTLDSISNLLTTTVIDETMKEVTRQINNLDGVAQALELPAVLPGSDATLALHYAAKKAASSLDAIPGALEFCIDCFQSRNPGPEADYPGFPRGGQGSAHIGLHTQYQTVNRSLEFLHQIGQLDFCLLDGSSVPCDRNWGKKGNFDLILFRDPPTVGWDSKGFYVDVPSVTYQTNNGAITHLGTRIDASMRVYGQISSQNTKDGAKILFQPTDVKLRSGDFSGGDLFGAASEIANVVVNKTRLGNTYASRQVQSLLKTEVPLPDFGINQIHLKPDSSGLTAYAVIQEPGKIIPWFDLNPPAQKPLP